MNRLAILFSLLITPALLATEPKRDRFGDPLPDGAIARLGTVQAHVGAEGIAFSADGKKLISWSRHAVRHWDAKTGRIIRLIERPMPDDAWLQVVSADGRTGATVWNDRLEIHDVETQRVRHRVELPKFENMTALEVSAGGERVMVSLQDFRNSPLATYVVRTDTGKVDRWDGVTLFQTALSRNGERIAGTDIAGGRRVCCRDAAGKLLCRLPFDGHAVAFTPDGTGLLVQESDKGHALMVDVATGGRRTVDLPRPGNILAGTFSPDGRLLAVGVEGGIALWDMKAGKAVHRWDVAAASLAFSPDGTRLAASDDLMHCWDVTTGKPVWPEFGPLLDRNHHHASYFSRPAGNLLTLWDPAGRLQVWDWTTGKLVSVSPVVKHRTREAMWLTPDRARAFVCTDRHVIGWDLVGGKEIRNFAAKPPDLTDHDWYIAAESADCKSVAVLIPTRNAGKMLGRAWLIRWDVRDGRLIDRREIEFHARDFLRIMPDGRHVSDRDTVIDTVTGRRQTVATAPSQFEISMPLDFSASGHLVMSQVRPEIRNKTTELIVWETATAKPLLRRPVGVQQTVVATLSPDNRWLAVPSAESIELWDLTTGQRAAQLRHRTVDFRPDPVYYCLGLQFLPGRRLIAAYSDRTALVWQMPPETEKTPPQRLNDHTRVDLASTEPREAQDAVWALVNEPAKGIALLRDRLKPAVAPAEADIAVALADLAGANFARREAAFRRLRGFGHAIEKRLEAALTAAMNAEQSGRIQVLLDTCRDDGPANADERRAVRAFQALGQIANADARALLESWSKGDAAALLTSKAKAALRVMDPP